MAQSRVFFRTDISLETTVQNLLMELCEWANLLLDECHGSLSISDKNVNPLLKCRELNLFHYQDDLKFSLSFPETENILQAEMETEKADRSMKKSTKKEEMNAGKAHSGISVKENFLEASVETEKKDEFMKKSPKEEEEGNREKITPIILETENDVGDGMYTEKKDGLVKASEEEKKVNVERVTSDFDDAQQEDGAEREDGSARKSFKEEEEANPENMMYEINDAQEEDSTEIEKQKSER